MSQSTNTLNTESTADVALGRKVTGYALQLMAQGMAMAMAWSCSSVVLGIILFIIMSLVLGLIAFVLNLYLQMTVAPERFESIGHKLGSGIGAVRNLFARTPKVAA